MTMFFKMCKTAEELKKAYREIVKKLHPDNGGEASLFKTMQAEFSSAWERLKNIHINKDGQQYTKETNETAQEFMDIIEQLLKLDGVEVEMCGSWIWCTGNTQAHKNELKKLKFTYSKPKVAWYYHREPYRKRSASGMSLDAIRSFYGSVNYGTGKASKEEVKEERILLKA